MFYVQMQKHRNKLKDGTKKEHNNKGRNILTKRISKETKKEREREISFLDVIRLSSFMRVPPLKLIDSIFVFLRQVWFLLCTKSHPTPGGIPTSV